jgi:hypothetical protein
MIRYVHIGRQILSDRNQFALYDTVTDQFLTFLGSDTFDSVEDLDESMKLDDVGTEMRERCLSLCRHHDNPRPDDLVADFPFPTYADLVALIRQAEWSGAGTVDDRFQPCPWCKTSKTKGHTLDCPAARVLYPEER